VAYTGRCDASLGMDLVEASRPPDPDLVDLIEQAFLEGQIDGQKADLAYTFLRLELGDKYCTNVQ